LRRENELLRRRLIAAGITFQRPDLPTEKEFDRLLALVISKYPRFRPQDAERYRELFVLAFEYLCEVRRRETADRGRSGSFWCDEFAVWAGRVGQPTNMSIGPLTAAALAHGDIIVEGLGHFPHSLALGLAYGGVGRAYRSAWRQVLQQSRLPGAAPDRDVPGEDRSNVTFRGGDDHVGGRAIGRTG
jgi:hypothetical protein